MHPCLQLDSNVLHCRVAFLVKTGSKAAQQRGAIQVLTWLAGVKNFIMVGEEPGGQQTSCGLLQIDSAFIWASMWAAHHSKGSGCAAASTTPACT